MKTNLEEINRYIYDIDRNIYDKKIKMNMNLKSKKGSYIKQLPFKDSKNINHHYVEIHYNELIYHLGHVFYSFHLEVAEQLFFRIHC